MIKDYIEILVKIIVSIILGGLIGLERERRNRPAGLRTHILVSLGSCLFTISSIEFSKIYGSGVDPSRVAANIVTGVGFLGAGTIMKEGLTIKGLTTAATIWLSSAIGLTCGLGFYIPAILTTLLAYLVLIFVRVFEYERFKKYEENLKIFNVRVTDKPGQLGKIGTIFGKYGIHIKNVKFERDEKSLSIEFVVSVPQNIEIKDVCNELSKEEFVIEVSTE